MKLLEVLEEQGRKQTWLAEKLGVTPGTVNNWCKGRTVPNDEMKIRISILLEVGVEKLFYQEMISSW